MNKRWFWSPKPNLTCRCSCFLGLWLFFLARYKHNAKTSPTLDGRKRYGRTRESQRIWTIKCTSDRTPGWPTQWLQESERGLCTSDRTPGWPTQWLQESERGSQGRKQNAHHPKAASTNVMAEAESSTKLAKLRHLEGKR